MEKKEGVTEIRVKNFKKRGKKGSKEILKNWEKKKKKKKKTIKKQM
ncbi:hypothetical protein [Clostridium sp. ZBS2]|nr:hypothetical protein [Clostridium sp. ZBS2]